MESPLNIGDVTTNSIQHRLNETHLSTTCSSVINSAVYSGQKLIQLSINLQAGNAKQDNSFIILRRVQDSYVNISQLFSILIKLHHFNQTQLESYLLNEIITNVQYQGSSKPQFDDFRNDENPVLRGIWISYDKAVNLALKFDVYEFAKKLFLVDVHDFDQLPNANKRLYKEDDEDDEDDDTANASLMGSPSKRQKLTQIKDSEANDGESVAHDLIKKYIRKNTNFPYTLPPVNNQDNQELVGEIKLKLSEVFKRDEEANNTQSKLTFKEIKAIFQPLYSKYSTKDTIDIPLDQKGQTALHFAATLASLNLVFAFIELEMNSPIRGNVDGESPLIAAIQVTNAMEKGNFQKILTNWLYPNLWLFDNKKLSFLHHLTSQATTKLESSKFYTTKIVEYLISKESYFYDFFNNIINSKDNEHGNTCLHMAAENEMRWFIKLFLELKADVNIANNRGIKPIDFDIVKDIMNSDSDEFDDHIFEYIRTSVEFLDKRLEINGNIPEIEDLKPVKAPERKPDDEWKDDETKNYNPSNKIFQSIQDLLANTNVEYENILNSKREQIKNLNKSLHDSTIVTANNRFITKRISEKLVQLDNLKLQMANLSDNLQSSKLENEPEVVLSADDPYIITELYERLSKDEAIDDLKTNQDFLDKLQPVPILKARINAYKKINSNIENELNNLLDYSELTSKFKKVVSICTGVDINEVDELLDGLLEAVEGQQWVMNGWMSVANER